MHLPVFPVSRKRVIKGIGAGRKGSGYTVRRGTRTIGLPAAASHGKGQMIVVDAWEKM